MTAARGRLDPAVADARLAVTGAIADLDPGARVALAVSGGADSLALAAAAAFVGRDGRLALEAVVVDHGLQDGSAEVARRAAEQVGSLGVPATVVRVDVGTDGGTEAAARRARYAVLDALDVEAVLLGHTLDDQAETVLLGLGRGSGPRSLAGMAPVAGRHRRPFLGLRRATTEQVCRALGLDPWHDPHNDDPRFRRVRVRHEVLPLLEDVLGGGVAEALARTASLSRADADLLDALAAERLPDPLDVLALAAEPAALRSRALRQAAVGAGADAGRMSAGHVAALDALVTAWRGQARVELPGQVAAVREGTRLRFVPTPVAR
ncbi:tRNA lysidine(34) synthetase TilS [Aeromicrobium sp. IC_218]|uniref:tRNA lysidine(34) synthetase TilS n=1 Tax=Aeromicrobium sp. IC_218 TaxID=2545468 RepID=UPI0010404BBA|nr:tRNA lysidine(34) synthetase TilS [Aeromicrobium sp. IC_218]TCJ00747.1 tRNA lysidine(34) synthetase TilS [Aeromicrobium sp. IC_218]